MLHQINNHLVYTSSRAKGAAEAVNLCQHFFRFLTRPFILVFLHTCYSVTVSLVFDNRVQPKTFFKKKIMVHFKKGPFVRHGIRTFSAILTFNFLGSLHDV